MIYISTNMFQPLDLEKVYEIIGSVDFDLGIEVFPMFHIPGYQELSDKNRQGLKNYPLTFHEPYYQADHSYLNGDVFLATRHYYEKLLSFQDLSPKYIVYHYNSRKIQDRDLVLESTRKGLDDLGQESPIPLLIESVGVKPWENILLKEEEFIEECLERKENVLTGVGHANTNAWDVDHLLSKLENEIRSYHLHNNDSYHGLHQSIFHPDMAPDIQFIIQSVKKHASQADLALEYGRNYDQQIRQVIQDAKRLHQLWIKQDSFLKNLTQ